MADNRVVILSTVATVVVTHSKAAIHHREDMADIHNRVMVDIHSKATVVVMANR